MVRALFADRSQRCRAQLRVDHPGQFPVGEGRGELYFGECVRLQNTEDDAACRGVCGAESE